MDTFSRPEQYTLGKLKRFAGTTILAFATSGFFFAPLAIADDVYPSKAVKVIVNFPAGGPADVLARTLGDKLQSILKQPFVVDNRPGSGGNIGAAVVAKADPDGYTILISVDSPFTVNPGVYPSMPFAQNELRPAMVLGTSGMAVAVHPASGIHSMKELVARGKKEALAFSSAGNGSPGHLASSMLTKATGTQVLHVPYKGNAPAVTALLANEVQGAILAAPGLVPHFQSGRLKPLAVTGSKRSALLPDVPTTAEAGFPEVNLELFYVVMVPGKTSDEIITKLQKALTVALAQPEVQSRLKTLDFTSVSETGSLTADRITKTRDRYAKIARETGMKVE